MKYILSRGLIFSRILSAPLVIYLATLLHFWMAPAVVAIIWFVLIGNILDGIAFFLPRWTLDTQSTYNARRIRQGLPIKKHKLFHGE